MLLTLTRHSVWFQGGSTPLHEAASSGHLDVVRYLITEAAVDAGMRDRVSHTADGVCMYVCIMHVCMYACMYVYMHVCMYVCLYVCMYAGVRGEVSHTADG